MAWPRRPVEWIDRRMDLDGAELTWRERFEGHERIRSWGTLSGEAIADEELAYLLRAVTEVGTP